MRRNASCCGGGMRSGGDSWRCDEIEGENSGGGEIRYEQGSQKNPKDHLPKEEEIMALHGHGTKKGGRKGKPRPK